MVTRFQKSSKTRNSEYHLLWRLEPIFGRLFIRRAIAGDLRAIEKLEEFAWEGRKRPALAKWVAKAKAKAKRELKSKQSQGAK